MNAARFPMLALAATLAAGCAAPADAPSTDLPEPVAAAPRAQGVALRLEQAERSLDVGRDVAGTRASLEEALRDPSITPDQRDQARIALSRAIEAGGDSEGAVAPLEALLADHPDGPDSPAEEIAGARLRKLLTGTDAEPRSTPDEGRPASPFAHVLTRYFTTPSAGKALDVRVFSFGGSSERSERLGTFAIGPAAREDRRQACPLCDERLSISTQWSGSGSWVGIPKNRARFGNALAVFYFDLGRGRIPARYDAELPLPSAEIAARLDRGEGLVAARERPGAPPVILIAAPREAQLAEVEEALAAMKKLPVEPVTVPVKPALNPQEIQSVVRGSFGAYRACYEAVQKNDPAATGTAKLHFAIRNDGSVEGVSVDTTEGSLHDATFESCMTAATRLLTFPTSKTQGSTTVTYPVVFSPGP